MKKYLLIFGLLGLMSLKFDLLFAQDVLERAATSDAIEKKMALSESVIENITLNPCSMFKPDVFMQGKADNFINPTEPAVLSPNLTSFIHSIYGNLTARPFDQTGCDRPFAASFKLKTCKVCYATLELKIKKDCGQWCNDGIKIGVVNGGTTPTWSSSIFYAAPLWCNPVCSPGCNPISPTTKTLVLSTAALNNYICNSAPCPGALWLDAFIQDDTNIDYMKLSIWYCQ